MLDLEVVNEATEAIAELSVEVFGEKITWHDVQIGQRVFYSRKTASDSHYEVKVTFESGVNFSKQLGYLTHGVDFKDQLVVIGHDVVLKREEPQEPR